MNNKRTQKICDSPKRVHIGGVTEIRTSHNNSVETRNKLPLVQENKGDSDTYTKKHNIKTLFKDLPVYEQPPLIFEEDDNDSEKWLWNEIAKIVLDPHSKTSKVYFKTFKELKRKRLQMKNKNVIFYQGKQGLTY